MSGMVRAMWRQALRDLDIGFAVSRYPQADLGMAPAGLVAADQAAGVIAAAERVLAFARSRGVEALWP